MSPSTTMRLHFKNWLSPVMGSEPMLPHSLAQLQLLIEIERALRTGTRRTDHLDDLGVRISVRR